MKNIFAIIESRKITDNGRSSIVKKLVIFFRSIVFGKMKQFHKVRVLTLYILFVSVILTVTASCFERGKITVFPTFA